MAATKIVTNGDGVHMLVESDKRLTCHKRRLFITDISKDSLGRIISALACSTVSAMDIAKRCPNTEELRDLIAAGNELAASELDMLGEYRYTLHCMTN